MATKINKINYQSKIKIQFLINQINYEKYLKEKGGIYAYGSYAK